MKANVTSKTLKAIAIICSFTVLTPVHAAKNDLAQEITIKSKRQSADLKNKIASYLDNVSIHQGSIAITADIVKVFSTIDQKTGKKHETYFAKGKPATFEQKLEDGSLIQLQADEVTYLPISNSIEISGNAIVKQAGSEVSGNKISYNLLSEKLEAQSLQNQSVTTILKPTVLKKQKAFHEQSKVEKDLNKESTKKGNTSDN